MLEYTNDINNKDYISTDELGVNDLTALLQQSENDEKQKEKEQAEKDRLLRQQQLQLEINAMTGGSEAAMEDIEII